MTRTLLDEGSVGVATMDLASEAVREAARAGVDAKVTLASAHGEKGFVVVVDHDSPARTPPTSEGGEEGPMPDLHERDARGGWICCCGDHLTEHSEPLFRGHVSTYDLDSRLNRGEPVPVYPGEPVATDDWSVAVVIAERVGHADPLQVNPPWALGWISRSAGVPLGRNPFDGRDAGEWRKGWVDADQTERDEGQLPYRCPVPPGRQT
jgi:hypothetical protein